MNMTISSSSGPPFRMKWSGSRAGQNTSFPGISGADMINATHWLGALSGVVGTIGLQKTPVRAMIDAAAEKMTIPITLIALVVEDHDLSGIFIGDRLSAWSAAVESFSPAPHPLV